MNTIRFYSDHPSYRFKGALAHRAWLERVFQAEKRVPGSIQFVFIGDEDILELNRRHLAHDYYTDILTFPYHSSPDLPIEGDVYISVERARENAMNFECSQHEEIRRLLIHGTLHLIGYMDTTDSEKQVMTDLEDFYLARYSEI